MAEEEPKITATEADKEGSNGKRGGKKDDVPVEELYDLSKPIPRVDRPDKAKHEAKLAEITERFEVLKNERQKLQEKIDNTMNSGKGSEISKLRDAFSAERQKKNKLIEEKRGIRSQLDILKVTADKLQKEKKDTKGSIKYSSVEEIDKAIAKLQRQQETTSMSLSEEKRLIKDIDALQASKDKVKDLKSTETSMDDVKRKRNAINDSIKAKDKEIDAVSKELDELQKKIKTMSDKESSKRGALDGLFKERDGLKKKISATLKEKDAERDQFREKNNAWWNYNRAIKAQKKIEYEAEKAKREEERQAYLKKLEEEELKKVPYEAEQGLCDYLADYLERTYLGGAADKKVGAKKEKVVAVKDDPFAGFTPVNKKSDDADQFFSKGKGKKKRQRAKKQDQPSAGPFTLSVDSFEQFGLIGLNPPTKLEEVEQSVKDLREKKEWYKNQPRGSVPTAKDIRKQNEKNAAKVRSATAAAPSTPSSSKGKFSLSNDDFAPLGKGASSAVDASSWGQKPASEAMET